jgi:hypothetical protein
MELTVIFLQIRREQEEIRHSYLFDRGPGVLRSRTLLAFLTGALVLAAINPDLLLSFV